MDFFTYELLPVLLNMSITAGLMILVVLLARLLLRRAPRAWSYALWAVVLFRLLCPVSFTSELSLLAAVDAPAQFEPSGQISVISYVPENIVHDPAPSVQLPVPALNEAINPTLPQGEEQTVADPLEAPVSLLTILWAIVAAGMLLRGLVLYLDLKMRLWRSPKLERGVYVSKRIETAFVAGIIPPRVYLPEGLTEGERECVLAHERCHIRRGDFLIKPLAYIALSLHWFNPLVWLAWVIAMRDMEVSCDEAALRWLGSTRRADYAQTLLNMATGRRTGFGAALAFGDDTKRRIKEVAKLKPAKKWISVLAAVLAIAVIAGCAANPVELASPSPDGEGEYADMYEYVDSLIEDTVTYRTSDGIAEAPVLDAYSYVTRAAQLGGLVPDGKLESFCYSIYYQLDIDSSELVRENGEWSLDGDWYCFDPNRHAYALSYSNGSCDVLYDTKYEYDGSISDAMRLYDWYINDYGGAVPEDLSQVTGLGARGEYGSLDDYFNAKGTADGVMTFENTSGGTSTASVLAKDVWREKRGEISGLDPDGTLEAWVYACYYNLDADDADISLKSASMSYEGWYNFDGGNLVFMLQYPDGSFDVLREEPLNESIIKYRLAVDALWDWYVTENNIDLPLTTLDWGEELGIGSCTASLIVGDGWYAYCPSSGWSYSTRNGGVKCKPNFNTGASFSVKIEDSQQSEMSYTLGSESSTTSRTRRVPDGDVTYVVTGTWNADNEQEEALVNRMIDTFGVGRAYGSSTAAVGLSAFGGVSAMTESSQIEGDGWSMSVYGPENWDQTERDGFLRLDAKSGSGTYLELRESSGNGSEFTGVVCEDGEYVVSRTVDIGGQGFTLNAAWPEDVSSTEGIAVLESFNYFTAA